MKGRDHPHADEHRKPRTLSDQLEGASLFDVVDDDGPYPDTVPPGPHRVGRRSFTQDRAHAKAQEHAPNMRDAIHAHLLSILPDGQTREAIASATGFKLQTVCGRVNELLRWEVDDRPAPRVREGARVNGSALVFAIPGTSHSHSRA